MTKPVLVLLSGGLDSAVLLYWTLRQELHPRVVDFQFPGRLRAETEAAAKVATAAGIDRILRIDLPFVRAPKEELSAYIPKRNLMFYGIAASLAEQWDVEAIYGGHIQPDGTSFPDARTDFFESFNSLISASTHSSNGHGCRIETPFIRKGKADIIRLGRELGLPFEQTWSCLKDGPTHCWTCSSCKERREGFAGAGMSDPLFTPALSVQSPVVVSAHGSTSSPRAEKDRSP